MTTIERLMRLAEKELKNRLPDNMFADDWRWGENIFVVRICKYNKQTHNIIEGDVYSFSYDENEELWGTPEEQLNKWLDYWFY